MRDNLTLPPSQTQGLSLSLLSFFIHIIFNDVIIVSHSIHNNSILIYKDCCGGVIHTLMEEYIQQYGCEISYVYCYKIIYSD